MKNAAAVDELSLTHSPLPRPSLVLSITPLLDTDPSLNTYIISGKGEWVVSDWPWFSRRRVRLLGRKRGRDYAVNDGLECPTDK